MGRAYTVRAQGKPGAGSTCEIFRCAICGYMCVSPLPEPALIAAAFGVGFHESPQQHWNPGTGRSDEAVRAWPVYRNALRRLNIVRALKPSGRLLDIGCGKGAFVHAAMPYYSAVGVDAEPAVVEWCRRAGLEVQCGDFVTLDYNDIRFDVITLWDSLASIPDQARVFRRLFELLAESGVAVLTVPDAGALAARVLGPRWPLMIPPINIAFHTRRSLESLGKRTGLRLVQFRHQGKWIDAGFLARKLRCAMGFSAPVSRSRSISVFLNVGDIATAVFRKA